MIRFSSDALINYKKYYSRIDELISELKLCGYSTNKKI